MPTEADFFRKKPSLARLVFEGEGGWLRVFHAPTAVGWQSDEEAQAVSGLRTYRTSYRFIEGAQTLTLHGSDESTREASATLDQLAARWMAEPAEKLGPTKTPNLAPRPIAQDLPALERFDAAVKPVITRAVQHLAGFDVPAIEVLAHGPSQEGVAWSLRARLALRAPHRLILSAEGPSSLFDRLAADVQNWFDSATFDPR